MSSLPLVAPPPPPSVMIGSTPVVPIAQKHAQVEMPLSPPHRYPPTVVVGLHTLDIHNNPDDKHRIDIGASCKASVYMCTVHINVYNSTTLHHAGVSWLAVPWNNYDFRVGYWDTGKVCPGDRSVSTRIEFPTPFHTQPKLVLGINKINLGDAWRMHTQVSDIDNRGFTLGIDACQGVDLRGGAVTWIAFPASLAGVWSGSFNISKGREGRVQFGTVFKTPPQVFFAISSFDVANHKNLRARVLVSGITTTGMDWEVPVWWDEELYEVTVSYLAVASSTE